MGSQASKGGVTAEGKAAADASADPTAAKTNGQVGIRYPDTPTQISARSLAEGVRVRIAYNEYF